MTLALVFENRNYTPYLPTLMTVEIFLVLKNNPLDLFTLDGILKIPHLLSSLSLELAESHFCLNESTIRFSTEWELFFLGHDQIIDDQFPMLLQRGHLTEETRNSIINTLASTGKTMEWVFVRSPKKLYPNWKRVYVFGYPSANGLAESHVKITKTISKFLADEFHDHMYSMANTIQLATPLKILLGHHPYTNNTRGRSLLLDVEPPITNNTSGRNLIDEPLDYNSLGGNSVSLKPVSDRQLEMRSDDVHEPLGHTINRGRSNAKQHEPLKQNEEMDPLNITPLALEKKEILDDIHSLNQNKTITKVKVNSYSTPTS
eukprot:gene8439-10366_t